MKPRAARARSSRSGGGVIADATLPDAGRRWPTRWSGERLAAAQGAGLVEDGGDREGGVGVLLGTGPQLGGAPGVAGQPVVRADLLVVRRGVGGPLEVGVPGFEGDRPGARLVGHDRRAAGTGVEGGEGAGGGESAGSGDESGGDDTGGEEAGCEGGAHDRSCERVVGGQRPRTARVVVWSP